MESKADIANRKMLDNYQYYLDNYDELVKLYDGKVLVIVDRRVAATCDDEEQAYYLGTERYGLGNFIFQRCSHDYKAYTAKFHSQITNKHIMSTTALQGLLDYLCATLTPGNMRWVASHLIDRADKAQPVELKRYTLVEVNAMLDEAEADMVAGKGVPDEEAWHMYDKEHIFDNEAIMAEAV